MKCAHCRVEIPAKEVRVVIPGEGYFQVGKFTQRITNEEAVEFHVKCWAAWVQAHIAAVNQYLAKSGAD